MTKKYIKDFYKRLEELFWDMGTLQCETYSELAFYLGLDDDDRIKQAAKELEDQGKLSILIKNLEYWFTPVPF